jgi:Arc/MetJ-type ribon-helix-helix transcriptional regulator
VKKERMVTVSIQIPIRHLQTLKRIADVQDVSVSETVRSAIEAILQTYTPDKITEAERLKQKVIEANIALNHARKTMSDTTLGQIRGTRQKDFKREIEK